MSFSFIGQQQIWLKLKNKNMALCVHMCVDRMVGVCTHVNVHMRGRSLHEKLKSLNRLTPNDPYKGRTAPLTSKRCILYIYSTNIGTEYFKHALYSALFSLQNAVCFIMLTCLVPVLFTFYIQSVLKLKKNNSGSKGLNHQFHI